MPTDRELAFPRLSARQIAELTPHGTVRAVSEGEVLFSEGERDFAFYVVLSGEVEIVEHSSGEERIVTVHGPGEFTGDVDMMSGRGALVTGRVKAGGEVLMLSAVALRHVVNDLPEVGEVLLRAFLTRRTLLLDGGFEGIKIVGSRYSPAAHQLRDFATRNAIPHTWLDLELDPEAEQLLRTTGVPASATPVVIGRDGRWVSNPTVAQLASYVGLVQTVDEKDVYDLLIVGAGPAGLAAAVYAASEGLRTLTLDAVAAGGQAGTSSRIENYVGFPTGISGADLAQNALIQAQTFGAQFSMPMTVSGLGIDGGNRIVKLEDGSRLHARALMIASGIEYKRLDVPGLREFEGAGIYYAATEMEARMCAGDEVIVVGGGNSAGQAAVYLARYARRVHIVIRGDDLGKSMSRYLVDRIEGMGNITIDRGREVAAVEGKKFLERVRLKSCSGAEPDITITTHGLFIFIGAVPHTGWLEGCVALDAKGFVLTGTSLDAGLLTADAWRAVNRPPFFLETSLPGVFAVGDARSGSIKRVASAVGEGSIAISFVHTYLGVSA